MSNRIPHNCGIEPDILERFKRIFPEHADIEEYVATRYDSDPVHDSSSNSASLEQAQLDEALVMSLLQTQTLPPLPSNNAPVSAPQSHGSQNNTTNSETTVPAAESQGVPWAGSSLPAATEEPDNMTYEELEALVDGIGTESRGLSKELIARFPTQKLDGKSGWFASQKSKPEECPICIMEYETGEELLTLPCLHLYHKPCISQWLTDNKTCPVCNMDLSSPPQLLE